MQNVLFFLFRLYGGGTERVVSNISQALGDECNIKIAIYDDEDKTYPFKGELIRIKLPFSSDTINNSMWKRQVRLLFLIYRLRHLKRRLRIDTTISFGEQANIINMLTKGKGRTLLSVRSTLSREMAIQPKMDVLKPFIRRLYNHAGKIILPSKSAAMDLSDHFGVLSKKIQVIYNFIDPEKITQLASEGLSNAFYDQLLSKRILLNVGRITPAKGQWLLVKALSRIRKERKDFKLVIIGESDKEGSIKNGLFAIAYDLGLKIFDADSNQIPSLDFDIYLLGFKPNPFPFMKKSEIMVFPSVFEGFPNTILEAMQCGLPVISADCVSGPREIMAPGSDLRTKSKTWELTEFGLLCPALPNGDPMSETPEYILAAWIEAIQRLAEDEDLKKKFIENGYRRVTDFLKDNIINQWRESLL
jgi:glycosyltransferase involved in cell wall biosynthesis